MSKDHSLQVAQKRVPCPKILCFQIVPMQQFSTWGTPNPGGKRKAQRSIKNPKFNDNVWFGGYTNTKISNSMIMFGLGSHKYPKVENCFQMGQETRAGAKFTNLSVQLDSVETVEKQTCSCRQIIFLNEQKNKPSVVES